MSYNMIIPGMFGLLAIAITLLSVYREKSTVKPMKRFYEDTFSFWLMEFAVLLIAFSLTALVLDDITGLGINWQVLLSVGTISFVFALIEFFLEKKVAKIRFRISRGKSKDKSAKVKNASQVDEKTRTTEAIRASNIHNQARAQARDAATKSE